AAQHGPRGAVMGVFELTGGKVSGAAGLFRRGRMDAANVGSLAGLTSLGRVPPTWFSLFEQRDAFRPTHPPAMLNWGTFPDLPAASSLGGLEPALVDRR